MRLYFIAGRDNHLSWDAHNEDEWLMYHVQCYTISHYRSTQRCAAIFPASGMKHSQDDQRRPLRPPDGGRDDLIGKVMRKKRHRPDPSGSK